MVENIWWGAEGEEEKGLGSRVRQIEITCDSETEIMADRFNEGLLDVILNSNYSALLSARVHMHVFAAPNIPS